MIGLRGLSYVKDHKSFVNAQAWNYEGRGLRSKLPLFLAPETQRRLLIEHFFISASAFY